MTPSLFEVLWYLHLVQKLYRKTGTLLLQEENKKVFLSMAYWPACNSAKILRNCSSEEKGITILPFPPERETLTFDANTPDKFCSICLSSCEVPLPFCKCFADTLPLVALAFSSVSLTLSDSSKILSNTLSWLIGLSILIRARAWPMVIFFSRMAS